MLLLGTVGSRQIFYVNLRRDKSWPNKIPTENWVAFTITDKRDKKLVKDAVKICIDRNVSYCCSVGELADFVADYFDNEFVNRAIVFEDTTGKEFDFDAENIMTTVHANFSEGFWFATTLANEDNKTFDKVVCIDFTKRGVKNILADLVNKINEGWLPSREEVESPLYDK